MNFSCLYFYPRHLRHNLGRQACSSHFEEFQIGQSPIFRGCQIFVAFSFGKLRKLSDIFRVGGSSASYFRDHSIFLFKQEHKLNNQPQWRIQTGTQGFWNPVKTSKFE